jgi:RNA-directed DNA polymerase
VDELKAPGKPFDISKRAVWEAWEKVKANKGAPGVDAVTVAEFESDLKGKPEPQITQRAWGECLPAAVTGTDIAALDVIMR